MTSWSQGLLSVMMPAYNEARTIEAILGHVLDRPEVVSQLQSQGVDPAVARERVASMSDSEVQALNGQIGSLPAGAKMSHHAWTIVGVVVVALIIWSLWMK